MGLLVLSSLNQRFFSIKHLLEDLELTSSALHFLSLLIQLSCRGNLFRIRTPELEKQCRHGASWPLLHGGDSRIPLGGKRASCGGKMFLKNVIDRNFDLPFGDIEAQLGGETKGKLFPGFRKYGAIYL